MSQSPQNNPVPGKGGENILLLSGVRGDTRRYRVLHLYQQMRLAGLPVVLSHLTDPQLERKAQSARLVILHRAPCDRLVERLIAATHQRGGLVLVDVDDLIFDPGAFRWIDSPDFADPQRASLYQAEMQLQRRTIQSSDAVLASTHFLARQVEALGKLAWVHRNAANLELAQLSAQARQQRRPPDGKLVLGYASGTPTHNKDFALIAPALQEFLSRHPEAELWLLGYLTLEPGWQPFESRIRHFGPLPWRDLPARLAQFDINLAPLVMDNPFAQSKSEIKYMEAALAGVPTLASATEPFAFAIQHGQNGLLAASAAEWSAGLEQLADPAARARLAAAALAHALQAYSAANRTAQLVDTLNQIFTRLDHPLRLPSRPIQTPPEITPYLWPPEYENRPTLFQMGLYSLRQRGVGVLLKQAWVFFRRLVAPIFPYKSVRDKEIR